ncbi:MAG: hypothetical protein Q8787_02675, partial [Sweet potato little leaf phytoplasma]|nr:hypothetical protein [Sweet potato little leaf phytoplasma]
FQPSGDTPSFFKAAAACHWASAHHKPSPTRLRRFSTQEAINNMHQIKYKKNRISKLKDEMAAAIILQNFLCHPY